MIALKLLSWLIPIGLNVYFDRKGRKPNYLVMFILRGIAAIVHGGLIMDVQNMQEYLPIFIFQVTSFWIFFELGLNLVRGKPALYYDTRELDSGYIDRLFARLDWKWHPIAKFLTFIVMVSSIVVIWQRS